MASRKLEVQIVGDARNLARTFDKAGKSADSFGSRIGRSSKRIGLGIAAIASSAATVGIVTGRSFSAFEESLDRVVGLAGGARNQVAIFGEEILRLAPVVGRSPQELADALYFVASAGIAVADQMDVVTVSAKASAAGLGETQVVADAVTSAMNAYGSTVLSAGQATDVLVATVREGKGEASAFAPVIGTVAALASQLGVSFEEVGAALAAQTRLGISAETAAVQLQATFSSLLKTTPKTEKALTGVGLSSKGLREQLKEKGLLSVLTTLKESFGDNTAAMAQAFPNIRALRGLLALVGKNADQVRGVFDRMRNSTGALDLAFKAVSKGEAFKFRQTLASLAVVGIRVGAILAPVAKRIADGATKALTAVSTFLDKLGRAKTVRAKIDVIFDTAREFGTQALSIADRIRQSIGTALARINWRAVGQAVSIGLTSALSGIAAFIRRIHWEQVGGAVVRGIANFLKGVDWVAVFKGIVVLWITALRGLGNLLLGIGKELGRQLISGLGTVLSNAVNFIGQKALALVIKMLSVFSFLGRFDPFKGLREKAQALLEGMQADAQDASEKSPKKPRRITTVGDQAGGLLGIALAGDSGAKKAQKTAKTRAGAVAQTATVVQQVTEDAAVKAEAAAAAAESARQRQEEAFANLLDGLNLNLEKAQATAKLGDDLKALKAIEEAIRTRIKVEGKTIDLQRQLFQNRQQQAAAQLQQRQGSQFQALGLTATGEKPIASVGALTKRLGTLKDQIKGTFLDTPKTRAQLANIAKVLSGKFGAVGKNVRGAILQMFAEISGALNSGGEKTDKLTKRRITALTGGGNVSAFGLNFAQAQGGAGVTLGGGPPIQVQLFLDGKQVSDVVISDAQRRNRRHVGTRSGRHGGTKLF